jgi:hypothetical protein
VQWRCQRFCFGSAGQSLTAVAMCAGRLSNTTLIVCQLDPSSTAISFKAQPRTRRTRVQERETVTLLPAAFPNRARNGWQSRPTVSFAHLLRHLEYPGQACFLCAPGRIRTSVFGLGTRRSGQVFDQVRHGGNDRLATLFPKPSHEHGSLAVSDTVSDGEMTGGDD